jgi:hypothetical protein
MLMDYATRLCRPDLFGEMRRAQEKMNRRFGRLRLVIGGEFPPVNVWASAEGKRAEIEVASLAVIPGRGGMAALAGHCLRSQE